MSSPQMSFLESFIPEMVGERHVPPALRAVPQRERHIHSMCINKRSGERRVPSPLKDVPPRGMVRSLLLEQRELWGTAHSPRIRPHSPRETSCFPEGMPCELQGTRSDDLTTRHSPFPWIVFPRGNTMFPGGNGDGRGGDVLSQDLLRTPAPFFPCLRYHHGARDPRHVARTGARGIFRRCPHHGRCDDRSPSLEA